MLAAYVLDRRNKCDYITEDGLDLAMQSILQIAEQSNGTIESIELIVEEYTKFCTQKGRYSKYQQNEQTAESWWNDMSVCSSLRQVAIRIARLRSSTANIERTFSTLKYIQGSRRTNFSIESLVHLARVKIYDGDVLSDGQHLGGQDAHESLQELDCSDSVEDASIHEQQGVEDQQHCKENYVPELFDADTRKVFDTFSRYVDFSIVNRLISDPSEEVNKLSDEKMARLMEKGRRLRQSYKESTINEDEPIDRSLEHT